MPDYSTAINHRRIGLHFPVNNTSFLVLILFILPLLFTACGPSTETIIVGEEARPVGNGEEEDVEEVADREDLRILKIGESNRIRSMDPLFALNTATKRILLLTYDGLVDYDENDEIVPAVAKRWEVSEDSLTYTFYLRDDLFFHDDESFTHGRGRQVNSRDVKRVFERMASRDVPPNGAGLFLNTIRGFESFYQEQREIYIEQDREITDISGIYTENNTTIVFELLERDPYFLNKLASPYAVIYPDEPFRFRNDGLHSHPVGTGPFRYDTSIGDSIYVFLRNNAYYKKDDQGRQLPRVHRIELMNVTNEDRLYTHFTRDRLNVIFELGPANVQKMLNENNELKDDLQDKYYLERRPDPDPVILRYNNRNRFGLGSNDAAAVVRHVHADTLRARMHHPSLEITYRNDEFTQTNVGRIFQRFGHGQGNSLIFAFNQDHLPRTLSNHIYRSIDENLRVELEQRRAFSRDIFIYLDYLHSYIPDIQHDRLPDEILRIETDRYMAFNRDIEGVRTNSLAWWINLNYVRAPHQPFPGPEATRK